MRRARPKRVAPDRQFGTNSRIDHGIIGAVAEPGDTRYPCAVCGDPWMLDAPDYVELVVYAPDTEERQWLGAHASCLNKFFGHVRVEIGGVAPPSESG
jgi:hypothetical protein